MTTLVTGIGLVGTAFARCALQRGEPVVFLDLQARPEYLHERLGPVAADIATVKADIRDQSAVLAAVRDHRVETVVHTAGLIGDSVSRQLRTGLDVNVMGTINVLEAVRMTRVRRLVHISSFAVYDRRRAKGAPITEDAPRGPGRAYGNSKVMKELAAESYQKEFRLRAGGSTSGQRLRLRALRGGIVRVQDPSPAPGWNQGPDRVRRPEAHHGLRVRLRPSTSAGPWTSRPPRTCPTRPSSTSAPARSPPSTIWWPPPGASSAT